MPGEPAGMTGTAKSATCGLRFDLSDALWQDRREKGGESIPAATRLKDPRDDAEHD
jgi:hypothetical protein